MKKILLLTAILLTVHVQAQTIFRTSVGFESDSDAVSGPERNRLLSFLTKITPPASYQVSVIGHTDHDGSETYNDALSIRRAEAVAAMLRENGFQKEAVSTSAMGFREPLAGNDSDTGKRKNRRVEVVFSLLEVNSTQLGGLELSKRCYSVKTGETSELHYPSGTVVHIPPGAFVDENGNAVTGTVELTYVEYRDPTDFILGNIPMTVNQGSDSNPFNSSGMYRIEASQKGKAVFIAEGKSIGLDFPLEQDVPDTNFYRFDEKKREWVIIKAIVPENPFPVATLPVKPEPKTPTLQSNRPAAVDCAFLLDLSTRAQHYLESDSVYYGMEKIVTEKSYYKNERLVNNLREKLKKADSVMRWSQTQIDRMRPYYQIEGTNKDGYHLVARNDKNPSSYFRNTVWKSDRPLDISAADMKKTWSAFEIATAGDGYTILLREKDATLTLSSMTMDNPYIEPRGLRNLTRKFHIYQKTQLARVRKIEQKRLKSEAVKKELDSLILAEYVPEKMGENLAVMDDFWNDNREFMTPEEQKLTVAQWFACLDTSRSVMQQRYSRLIRDNNCNAVTGSTGRGSVIPRKALRAIAKLEITSLGIYNCDQITRLMDPATVYARYEKEDGSAPDPAFIYIVDGSINGVLRYDGYNGYGPGRFAYGRTTPTYLVAFDETGAYVIGKEAFRKAVSLPGSRKTFVVRKLDAVKSKEELQAYL